MVSFLRTGFRAGQGQGKSARKIDRAYAKPAVQNEMRTCEERAAMPWNISSWVIVISITIPLVTGLTMNPARAEVTTLPASRDVTLFEDAEGAVASGSGLSLFVGDNSANNTRRALIHFAVGDSVPADAKITSVELWMHVSSAPNETPQNVMLHRVLSDWGEGASVAGAGRGVAAEPGDATWLHRFYPDVMWSATGGDFDPSDRGTVEVAPTGWHTWTGEALVEDVQSWSKDPESNFGWLLMGAEGVASSARGIDSREAVDPGLRPYLVVTYEKTGVATESSSWSRVKAGY